MHIRIGLDLDPGDTVCRGFFCFLVDAITNLCYRIASPRSVCRVADALPFCDAIFENDRPEGRPYREVMV